jgi:hypothetical protein
MFFFRNFHLFGAKFHHLVKKLFGKGIFFHRFSILKENFQKREISEKLPLLLAT